MSRPHVLFGFHAITVRLKTAPQSIIELHIEPSRRDARMRAFAERAREAGIKVIESEAERLDKMAGSPRHQGVVARVEAVKMPHSLDEVVENVEGPPLLLVHARAGFTGAVPFVARPLATLGRWSLSFYMIHQLVLIGSLELIRMIHK